MFNNTIIKKNKVNFKYHYLKHKLNNKYKKIQKINKYSTIYNPRNEINAYTFVTAHRHKFYINK